jgi:hypothetical protein
MLLLDDCDAESVEVLEEGRETESEVDAIIHETFDHLGRSLKDETPKDPDDEMY